MKKKILIFAIVLITIFAAVSCSYTFRTVGTVRVVDSSGDLLDDAYVYLFDSEENASKGIELLWQGKVSEVREYSYRSSTPVRASAGLATLDIRWSSSSPTDGKDDDQRLFWTVAFIERDDGTYTVSESVERTVYSDGRITGLDNELSV